MGGLIELLVPRPEDMRALGQAVGSLLGPGDVVVLAGDLGAGKTTFVQGAAGALGVDQSQVVSPTFTLIREYNGTRPVHHVDVYRLDRVQEVIDLGFEDFLDTEGVTFVEWGDMIDTLLPEDYLQVELWVRAEDEGRKAFLTGSGRSWVARWERLESVAEPWTTRDEAPNETRPPQ